MRTILAVRKLGKTFKMGRNEEQHILKDIDMEVHKGESVAIMGQSGSGKSTLLYNISGMDRMTSGSVLFDGEELAVQQEEQLAALRLNKMGFVFQQGNLMKNLNIFDNIIMAATLAGKESRRVIHKRARELMKHVGISELADHEITQVSGGQLQRAAICRALMNRPEILFGDEPTGALNSAATDEVMDVLAQVNEAGTTVVLVTHDARVAAKSERVLFMADGRIVAQKHLGKYDKKKKNSNRREEELADWLKVQGF